MEFRLLLLDSLKQSSKVDTKILLIGSIKHSSLVTSLLVEKIIYFFEFVYLLYTKSRDYCLIWIKRETDVTSCKLLEATKLLEVKSNSSCLLLQTLPKSLWWLLDSFRITLFVFLLETPCLFIRLTSGLIAIENNSEWLLSVTMLKFSTNCRIN